MVAAINGEAFNGSRMSWIPYNRKYSQPSRKMCNISHLPLAKRILRERENAMEHKMGSWLLSSRNNGIGERERSNLTSKRKELNSRGPSASFHPPSVTLRNVPLSPVRSCRASSSSDLSAADSVPSCFPETEISSSDVLCGRGAGAISHPGNITFRTLVAKFQSAYLNAKAIGKADIATCIVTKITDNGGRFLKRYQGMDQFSDDYRAQWYDIGEKAAREKTCQALRERGPSGHDAVPERLAKTKRSNENSSNPKALLPNDGKVNTTAMTLTIPLQRSLAGLSHGVVVNDNDVLLGRGGVTNSHIGNKTYRKLVRQRQREYLAAPKMKKSKIAMSIVNDINGRGGRFLMIKGDGKWVEATRSKARDKTSQALREKAPEMRRVYEAAASLLETSNLVQEEEPRESSHKIRAT